MDRYKVRGEAVKLYSRAMRLINFIDDKMDDNALKEIGEIREILDKVEEGLKDDATS